MSLKTVLFGGKGAAAPSGDLGLLLLRLFAGISLALAHGMGKLPPKEGFVAGVGKLGFPAPEVFAYLAGFSEFIGGLLLALGLMTKPASFAIAFTMVVAAFGRHAADPFQKKELALLYLAIAAMFLLVGAGRYSLDNVLAGKGK